VLEKSARLGQVDSVFLHFNLSNVKAMKVSDAGAASEFYWTFQLFTEEEGGASSSLAQGFSLGCPVDDGYSLRVGEQRKLNDPRFTVALPEPVEGETRLVSMDLYCWESDHSSSEVKKVFTNAAAQEIMAIHEQSQANKRKAREEILRWLSSESNEVLQMAMEGAAGVTPYVAMARAAVPLLKWVIAELRNNSDDLIGRSRTELFYAKQDGKLHYRWLVNDGVETWMDQEEAPYFHEHEFLEASGGNHVVASAIYQTVYEYQRRLV